MYRRKQLPLGGWLLLVLFFLGVFAIRLFSGTNFLRNGVTAQGVIVGEQSINCGKSGTKNTFSVQFTDQAGQAHTGTISQCDFSSFYASSGSVVAVTYLPSDPTVIAPPSGLISNNQVSLIGIIVFGFAALISLLLWIRKRMSS